MTEVKRKMRLCLTGCGGSIAVHLIAHIFTKTDWEIVGLDSFQHKGWIDRIKVIIKDHPEWEERITIFKQDLTIPFSPIIIKQLGKIDYIINMASLSDVEASIQNPVPFIENNVKLAVNMLEYARKAKPKAFIQISCYDEKTRAVTKDGLKYSWELKVGDEVLTLNENREPEFNPVEKVIIQDYEGEMVSMRGNTDVLVTPNHRMYNENMKIKEAQEIKNSFTFPCALRKPTVKRNYPHYEYIRVEEKEYNAKDFMYLLGVFIGDGFTAYQEKEIENKSGLSRKEFVNRKDRKGRFVSGKSGKKSVSISKSYRIFFDVPQKDKARSRLEKTLTSLGFRWTSQKGKSGEHIYLTHKELCEWFDMVVGKGVANKRIPKLVWNLEAESLQALYDGLIDSDGWYGKNKETYTTISKNLMSDVVLLSHLLGNKTSNYYKYSESNYEGRVIKGGANQVLITRTSPVITKQILKVPYKGKVWCVTVKNKNFLVERNGKFYFSGNTDEVYGPVANKNDNGVKEWGVILPSNPYAASKACQEAIAISYWRTYDVPVIITNTMNNFGELQQPSKFPVMVQRWITNGEKVIIHGEKRGDKVEIGSRSYIHSRNFADALLFILKNLPPHLHTPDATDKPDRYNIAGDLQLDNLELAKLIGKLMGKPDFEYEVINVHSLRPGHDRHYSLSREKLEGLGWKPPMTFEESLKNTIQWQMEHPEWINN